MGSGGSNTLYLPSYKQKKPYPKKGGYGYKD
jgi:hypothetical protein